MKRTSSRIIHRLKDLCVVTLAGVLAAVVLYTARDDHRALGLLPTAYSAEPIPQVLFHSTVLTDERFIELDRTTTPVPLYTPSAQVSAAFIDPVHPPAPEELTAYNTGVGGEVAIYWERSEFVEAVNILRRSVNEKGETVDEVVVENSTANSVIDQGVKNGVEYFYRAISLNTITENGEKQQVESVPTLEVSVIPADTIPPQPAQNVVVTSVTDGDKKGLHITWKNPLDGDIDHTEVYRSTELYVQGEQVATTDAKAPAEYLDETVIPNLTYYYTVVVYDTAGNASIDDLSVPTPGTQNPFNTPQP
jgi:hypothetical protein